jgi:hypothetical protein
MQNFDVHAYNTLCADYLGWKYVGGEMYESPIALTIPPKKGNNLCHTALVFFVGDMQFHSDWNWIMLVVEKIKSETEFVLVEECTDEAWWSIRGVTGLNITSRKESVVVGINNFMCFRYRDVK